MSCQSPLDAGKTNRRAGAAGSQGSEGTAKEGNNITTRKQGRGGEGIDHQADHNNQKADASSQQASKGEDAERQGTGAGSATTAY